MLFRMMGRDILGVWSTMSADYQTTFTRLLMKPKAGGEQAVEVIGSKPQGRLIDKAFHV